MKEQSITPLYDAAKAAMKELKAYVDAGFPGATLEDLASIANNYQPEHNAAVARVRAEKKCGLMLVCLPIKAELDAVGLAPKYRQAVYKERLGVRKGRDAYYLMELPND